MSKQIRKNHSKKKLQRTYAEQLINKEQMKKFLM